MTKLTIGMAHWDDFDGVYFTIQSIRLNNLNRLQDLEFVVINNSPHLPGTAEIKGLLAKVEHGGSKVKYHEFPDVVGTSLPRNRIFDMAESPAVLALDCHVLMPPWAIPQLIDFYDHNPDTKDLYSGPMIDDHLMGAASHFNDQWREEMWGTWGLAWRCGCDPDKGSRFSMLDMNTQANARTLVPPQERITKCVNCGKKIPGGYELIPWAQHEAVLQQAGFVVLAGRPDDPPFEIPGMGLGLFTCRKDAWLGFNKYSRGFGGEELYIHEKFRKAGHKAICLPFLIWNHRFARPHGGNAPVLKWDKARNYVLEFQELGLDVAPIREHFLTPGRLNQQQWDLLVQDPIHRETEPTCPSCNQAATENQIIVQSLDEAFDKVKATPRDLNQHMDRLKSYAAKVQHVTEYSERRESLIAFMAAKPHRIISHNTDNDPIVMQAKIFMSQHGMHLEHDPQPVLDFVPIEETDLLFLDTDHSYPFVKKQLETYSPYVRRFIVLHDTAHYGEKGPDGGPGLLGTLREFMVHNKEWTVVDHTMDQYGMTVLSRLDEDRPKLPGTWTGIKNFAIAVAKHVADGLKEVSTEELEVRLNTCATCPQRTIDLSGVDRCSVCTCPIADKARWNSEVCPLLYWPLTTEQQESIDAGKGEDASIPPILADQS